MAVDPRYEKLSAKTSLYNSLVTRVAEQIIVRVLKEFDCPFSLCLTDYQFLSAIGMSEYGTTSMSNLAHMLHLHPSSVTRRIHHLLHCRLITKTQDATDERRYFLDLTPEGRSLTTRLDDEMLLLSHKAFNPISPEEMETVYSFLDKCNDVFATLLKEGP